MPHFLCLAIVHSLGPCHQNRKCHRTSQTCRAQADHPVKSNTQNFVHQQLTVVNKQDKATGRAYTASLGRTMTSKQTEKQLDKHRNIQESLTDELLGMSAALKRNALAMQQGVAQRGAILEETDDSIERNLAMQQQSVKKSKEEYRRGSRSLWRTLLIMLAVGMAFVGIYFFIRFTTLLGYRKQGRHTEL